MKAIKYYFIIVVSFFGGALFGAEPAHEGRIRALMQMESAEDWKQFYKNKLLESELNVRCETEIEKGLPPVNCFRSLDFEKNEYSRSQKKLFLQRMCSKLKIDNLPLNNIKFWIEGLTLLSKTQVPESCRLHLVKLIRVRLYQLEDIHPIEVWELIEEPILEL